MVSTDFDEVEEQVECGGREGDRVAAERVLLQEEEEIITCEEKASSRLRDKEIERDRGEKREER